MTKRILGLDILRAIAILNVLHTHSFHFVEKYAPPIIGYVALLNGVELFFVLSGFLIGNILLKQIIEQQSITFKQIRIFWFRRWMRTLPAYYCILTINLLVIHWYGWYKDTPIALYFFFLQNFLSAHPPFFQEDCSLAIEDFFFIILPLFLWILFRIFQNFLSIKQIIIVCLVLIITLVILLRIQHFRVLPSNFGSYWPEWDSEFRRIVVYRLDSILYGVMAAFVKNYFHTSWKNNTFPIITCGVGLLGFIVSTKLIMSVQYGFDSFYGKVIYLSSLGISIMCFLPLADNFQIAKPLPRWAKVFTHISLISYSLYLVNQQLLGTQVERLYHGLKRYTTLSDVLIDWLCYVAFWFLSWLGATILYRFVEKPFMALRDKPLNR